MTRPNALFVTAIGTDSGKTLASAIITQALGATYYKPIQAGLPADTDTLKQLVNNPDAKFLNEHYRLNTPASPHLAAQIDGISIKLKDIYLPDGEDMLVVEGAGGILVPLNDNEFVIDLAELHSLPVVLVSNLYLGSINHTLLSIQELKRRNLKVLGIIFNGRPNPSSQDIILKQSGYETLLHIEEETVINSAVVEKYAEKIKPKLLTALDKI